MRPAILEMWVNNNLFYQDHIFLPEYDKEKTSYEARVDLRDVYIKSRVDLLLKKWVGLSLLYSVNFVVVVMSDFDSAQATPTTISK